MSERETRAWRLHELFEAGIFLKGLNAALELALGLVFLFVNVSGIIQDFIQDALVEDPDNFLATHLQPLAGKLTPGAETYGALYLISHGVIKAILVWGLVRERAWAFPASLAVLALFIAYQTIQFLASHSMVLVALTVFDAVIMWLIWVEYQRVQKKRKA